MNIISKLKNSTFRDPDRDRLLIIVFAIFVLMSILRFDKFVSVRNIQSMLYSFPELGVFSLGIMVALITGGIDLSIVGIANLSSVIAAIIMTRLGGEDGAGLSVVFLAVLVSLVVAMICGLFNGYIIGSVRIHPILATLGTFQLYGGLAVIITKGYAVFGFPESFIFAGNGKVLGIPFPFLIYALVVVFLAVVLKKTAFGKRIYLVGSNNVASRFSGINNEKVLLKTYMLVGLLGGIAGLIMIARTNSAKADYGASYTLQAILVCLLGGVDWTGGFGKISSVVISVIGLQFLSSGFNLLRFNNFARDFTWGAFLIFIIVFNYYMHKRDEEREKKRLSEQRRNMCQSHQSS